MVFPNPTITWNMSTEYFITESGGNPQSGKPIVEWLAKINVAITASTHWEVMHGGTGAAGSDYLAIKPSSSDAAVNKQRIVFAGHDTDGPNTPNDSNLGTLAAGWIIMDFCPDVTDAGDDDATYAAWKDDDVFASSAKKGLGFVPISTLATSLTHFHLIENEEALCIVLSKGNYDATSEQNYPTWVGAILTPLGPGGGDDEDRVWGVSWCGNYTTMGTSLSSQIDNKSNSVFGRSTYNSGSTPYQTIAKMRVLSGVSSWLPAWAAPPYIHINSYIGSSTTQAANRDLAGNCALQRPPVFRASPTTSTTICFGYMRQIYAWHDECLDREEIKNSLDVTVGYVFSPSPGSLREGWAHLNM